ncbi:MAG TPA: hydantoinase/oxoprolinase family protein [Syntrophales bacterium]|nr:hydantoinase/oxoprolinase family protein [Syntrophales bacterium]HPQ45302.1 hydantoinase/oxoprolinase family protein [Syntrophales bacterium]
MIIGIDVGGTHTDAVLLDGYKIRKKAKVITDQESLIRSLMEATEKVFGGEDPHKLEKIVLSTTISTNAIVQGKTDRVGMILAAGPGLSHEMLRINKDTHFISGYVNHRGVRVAGTDRREISRIVDTFKEDGIHHVGIVGKFSTRNPGLETEIADIINNTFKHLSFGHLMSGNLNFPRRIATTYLNAAIWDTYNAFVKSVMEYVKHENITAPIYILKADGGTSSISQSAGYPVGSILSGPAASIMGILSMINDSKDAVALDIGGTTTDIAIFADGTPLLEPLGVTIEGHKTLIRGLLTRSIGIGGDSRIRYDDGHLVIGPERDGPAAAFGGPSPTPTDAMIALGLTDIGDREKAFRAVKEIADVKNCSIEEMAKEIFELACGKIIAAVNEMLRDINNKPVYTVHEIFEGKKIKPEVVYIVGGPARPMAPYLDKMLGFPSSIPEHADVANAIGAALARTTTELTLLADTEKREMIIAEEGIQTSIPRGFTRDEAIGICTDKLRERALRMGAQKDDLDIEIIEDQVFNMVRGMGFSAGKNIRIKAQVKPGLIAGFRREAPHVTQ